MVLVAWRIWISRVTDGGLTVSCEPEDDDGEQELQRPENKEHELNHGGDVLGDEGFGRCRVGSQRLGAAGFFERTIWRGVSSWKRTLSPSSRAACKRLRGAAIKGVL